LRRVAQFAEPSFDLGAIMAMAAEGLGMHADKKGRTMGADELSRPLEDEEFSAFDVDLDDERTGNGAGRKEAIQDIKG
jgi:hypothetical protein